MNRHSRLCVAAALAVTLTTVLAGCGAGSLTDPRDIVTQAQKAMASVQSFHFQADATGQLVIGVDAASPSPGTSGSPGAAATASATPSGVPSPSAGSSATPGAASTDISLQGSSASGDIDLAAGTARLSGQVPGLPGVAGEMIVVDGVAYTRGPGETLYHQADASTLSFNPADASAGPSILLGILSMAADKSLGLTLVGTENCPEGSCYHVRVSITKEAANQQLGGGGLALGAGTVDLWILTDNLRVAIAQFQSSDPTAGTFWGRVALSNFGESVSVEAPPAEQVLPSGQ